MRRNRALPGTIASCVLFLLTFSAWPAAVFAGEGTTQPFERMKKFIRCEVFQPDFLQGDCAYTAMVTASDRKIYFLISSHNSDHSARFFSFDPATDKITMLGKLDEAVGEDATKEISQGKVHSQIFEHQSKIWMATHTAFYEEGLPGIKYGAKTPYRGGRFVSYDLKTGQFADLARVFPNEGIIAMTMDKARSILYGLTWPSGILVSYDIRAGDLRYWGAVQGRGEWSADPSERQRICRTLAIDPSGNVYGSTADGRIWKHEPNKLRSLTYFNEPNLRSIRPSPRGEDVKRGSFNDGWRAVEWNPLTKSFWGLGYEYTTLFEFWPQPAKLRSVTELRPEAYIGKPRNVSKSTQLGLAVGPGNNVFYIGHGPAIEVKGRKTVQSSLHLMTYQIDKQKQVDHGPMLTSDNRRPFYAESILIGPDDHIYAVAWVEVVDPERAAGIAAARKRGAPAETDRATYEMMLIRLPKWQEFIK